MTYLLADIGGTHARCALLRNGKIEAIEIVPANDFSNGHSLFLAYLKKHVHLGEKIQCAIAAAGRMDEDGIWRVGNNDDWEINPKELEKQGYPVVKFIGDFEASSVGAIQLDNKDLVEIHAGHPQNSKTKAICGPGTGLGLSYAIDMNGKTYIHRTHGGHMGAVSQTREQQAIMQSIKINRDINFVTFEDIIGGRSLIDLYKAVCEFHKVKISEDIKKAEDILDKTDDPTRSSFLRLFHEFLGLFIQTIIVTGSSQAGVYLDGGVIQKLYKNGLLDHQALLKYAHACSNDVVQKSLISTPIYLVKEPYVALKGLQLIIEGKISV